MCVRLTCPETGAILATMEEHMKYLKASVAYIRLQLRDHGPRFIKENNNILLKSILSQYIDVFYINLMKSKSIYRLNCL